MEKKINVEKEFKEFYGESPLIVVSAPGRVNLIGEHTDYNHGWVLPMAVERRVWAAGSPTDGHIELTSSDMPKKISVKNIKHTGSWADYPLGVMWALRENGYKIPGFRAHFHGNVPLGGGLSSSAAIEVATAMLLRRLFNFSIGRKEMALACQLAENNFVGMKCGAMDQMASALAEKGAALFIDCGDLSFERVPLVIGDYRIVVINSGVRRELAGSAYNRRRKECEKASEMLNTRSLRNITIKDIDEIEKLPEPYRKRARHVVTENDRVKKAAEHLKKGNLEKFGKLMKDSHKSLRFDYEVSVPELDFLVDSCNDADGVLGARLTGAGFGGCVVALAHVESIPAIEKKVLKKYKSKYKITPTLMTTFPDEGVREERLKATG